MTNVEAALAAPTPRFAPDDPTLPRPWKGLIDGTSGLTYYWNPETNITQYEKPTQVSLGAPPVVDTASELAKQHPQSAEVPQYQQHYGNQLSQHQGQYSVRQQPSHMQPAMQQVSQVAGSQYVHFGQGVPPKGLQTAQSPVQQGQMMEPYGLQTSQQGGQQILSQGPQIGQQPIHLPQHDVPQALQHQGPQALQHQGPQARQHQGPQARQHQGPPMGQSQGFHFMPPQMHYTPYQQPMQQNVPPSSQHPPQGSHFSYQHDSRNRMLVTDDSDYSKMKQIGISGSQVEQSGRVVGQGPPSMSAPSHVLQGSPLSGQSPSFGSSAHVHQPPSSIKVQESQTDNVQSQHPFSYQNQMDQSMMQGQQPGLPPIGRNVGYDGDQQGRGGQESHFSPKMEMSIMPSQHPNFAALPVPINQQDMRGGTFPLQNAPPSHDSSLNAAPHGMHSVYNHGNDQPMSNQGMRPSAMMHGSSDVMNIPSAEAYRLQHEVTATGDNVPPPFMTFEAAGLPPEMLRELLAAGFASPTPIQAQTWPIALQNRDIVAIAKTGSGKTLGYLMPAFMHLRQKRNNSRNGPTVLVLAPTRELATQIQVEAIKFGRSSRLICTCLYGGAPKGPQLEELRRGADIVVATPGRLNDILETRCIDLRQVSLLVLDEADRMLDMGFEPQIRKIVNEIPPRRQTLMYTATWPKEVRKIAGDLLNNPVQVNIGSVDELAANKSITQYVEVVPQMEKQRRLEHILNTQERGSKVIIFCSTKRLCDDLARSLRRNFPTAVIHGDKNQGERDYVLNQFRSGKSPILVATDVAARGLDVKDIRVVINYDFPTGIEDYVHRIGRTGRAGATGVAYTFLSEHDWKHAAELVKVLEGAEQPVPPEVREMAFRGGPGFGRDRSGMNNRFESGPSFGGVRWDSGGRGSGTRDGGFNGDRISVRDGGFGGRGGMRDAGFVSRGGPRDGGFGGRGMRDGAAMSGRGGRGDFGGPGNRGRGFGGSGGGYGGRSRDDFGSQDRFNNRDGFGRGRGRGRFDNRRDVLGRSRGRTRSPEKVRTWGGYSSSSSRSRSRSRSRSWSRSRSPRRSYSRSPRRSYSRSRSYDRNRGRSRSRSYERPERRDVVKKERVSGFDKLPDTVASQQDFIVPADGTSAEPLLPPVGSAVINNSIPPEKLEAIEELPGPVSQGDEPAREP